MPDVVGVEHFGRQRVAASVPGTTVRVDRDAAHGVATGNVSGSDSTERSAVVYFSSVPGGIS